MYLNLFMTLLGCPQIRDDHWAGLGNRALRKPAHVVKFIKEIWNLAGSKMDQQGFLM